MIFNTRYETSGAFPCASPSSQGASTAYSGSTTGKFWRPSRLEPEVVTGFYDRVREQRRIVRLDEVAGESEEGDSGGGG